MDGHWLDGMSLELRKRWDLDGESILPYVLVREELHKWSPSEDWHESDGSGTYEHVDERETLYLQLIRHQLEELVHVVRVLADVPADVAARPDTFVRLARRRLAASSVNPDHWHAELCFVEDWLRITDCFQPDSTVEEFGDHGGVRMLMGPNVEDLLQDNYFGIHPAPRGREWEYVGLQMLKVTKELLLDLAIAAAALEDLPYEESRRFGLIDEGHHPEEVAEEDAPYEYQDIDDEADSDGGQHPEPPDVRSPEFLRDFERHIQEALNGRPVTPAEAFDEGLILSYSVMARNYYDFTVDPLGVRYREEWAQLLGDPQDCRDELAALCTPLTEVSAFYIPGSESGLVVEATAPIRDIQVPSGLPILEESAARVSSRAIPLMVDYFDYDSLDDLLASYGRPLPAATNELAWGLHLAALYGPRIPDTVPSDAAESFASWQRMAIGRPFVPAEFGAGLRQVGEWEWTGVPGTKADVVSETAIVDACDALKIGNEVERFEAGDWRYRYHVSYSDGVLGTRFLSYVIVNDRLAVFTQRPYDDYLDAEEATLEVLRLAQDLQHLFRLSRAITRWPKGRLAVLDSPRANHQSLRWFTEPAATGLPVEPPDAVTAGTGVGSIGQAVRLLEALWLREQDPTFTGGDDVLVRPEVR